MATYLFLLPRPMQCPPAQRLWAEALRPDSVAAAAAWRQPLTPPRPFIVAASAEVTQPRLPEPAAAQAQTLSRNSARLKGKGGLGRLLLAQKQKLNTLL